MKMIRIIKTVSALLFAWLAVTSLRAQPTSANSISFQGALTGAGGQPLANGSYNLTFKFYTNALTPTALATSNVPNVPITNGVASTPIPVDAAWFDGQTRYLGISIAGINNGQELAPRVLITAVPNAMYAQTTRALNIGTNGFVGIGSTNPAATLDVGGNLIVGSAGDYGRGNLTIRGPNGPAGDGSAVNLDFLFNGAGKASLRAYRGGSYDTALELVPMDVDGSQPLGIHINSNGRVGIGTTAPHEMLDVNGTARMTVCQITSDRAAKEKFEPVKSADVLAKLVALPISTWAYTNATNTRHIGPVAQDFVAAFAVGEDDKHIATVDADGVALAAIQGLNQKLEGQMQEKDAKIQNLEKRLQALERKLESRFAANGRP